MLTRRCILCGMPLINPGMYFIKIQVATEWKSSDKENEADGCICGGCRAKLMKKVKKVRGFAKEGLGGRYFGEVERVESMCCDCRQPGRKSICGDFSENELCKYRKEDGSCWK